MPKLIDFLSHKEILRMLDKMGIDRPNGSFNLNYKSDFELQLETRGIELNSIDQIDFDTYDGFAFYKNKQILFYIRQPRNYGGWANSLPVFHVYKCKTTIDMIEKSRGYRYVATNKKTGYFELEFNRENIKEHELKVCQNCLNILKDKYSYYSTKSSFNIKVFFENASRIIHTFSPEYNDYNLPPPDEYPNNWQEIRKQLIKERGEICEDCSLNIKTHDKKLHVHHINSKKHDNSHANLKILCDECHEKYHPHLGVLSARSKKITVNVLP